MNLTATVMRNLEITNFVDSVSFVCFITINIIDVLTNN